MTKNALLTKFSSFSKFFIGIVAALTLVGLGMTISGVHADQNNQGDQGNAFHVKVLILTTFDGEAQPWTTHESFPKSFTVKGAHGPVMCQSSGICLTTVGEGKSNSGSSLDAILQNSQFNFNNTYFITTAIAGTRPDAGIEGFKGTLGFAGLADWVVDGDLGTHFDYRDVTTSDPADVQQYSWIPLSDYDNDAFHLNEQLVTKAYNLVKNISLADDATAQAARAQYPSQAGVHPFVAICDTVGADNFFSGTNAANTMDHIVRQRSNGAATKCTSEFEDPGFANALKLNGKLDHYISVRTASDFETPAPGQDAVQLLNSGFPGYNIATENEYRVGSTIAHYIATHPNF